MWLAPEQPQGSHYACTLCGSHSHTGMQLQSRWMTSTLNFKVAARLAGCADKQGMQPTVELCCFM